MWTCEHDRPCERANEQTKCERWMQILGLFEPLDLWSKTDI